ncbi:MAG: ABC transporter ATP-binding protein, partial [Clostridiales bacterium]|nr:ABC transporter ATP-binding protein [Clostridiales bacterium]
MLEIKNLTKEYIVNKKTGIKVVALDQVNLKFGETGLTAIVGKSGSGKTTLLNMLGGIDDPTSGAVIRNGKSLSAYTSAEYDEYRNFGTGFIFQDYNLLNDYSVIDNIKLAVKLQEDDKAIIDERAMTALEQVGLSELANRKINTLSGGQQQRIAIARAFAKESEMILCDEPTGNLDSKTSFEIFEILKTIAKERSVIVVTHDEELASKFADRLIRLRDGQVAEDFLITANEEAEPKEEEESKETKKKVHRGISVKDSLLMIKDNFFHAKISSFIVLVLLVAALSLTTVFSSLSGYDSEDALLNTLRANKQNVFQLTKYKDEPVTYYDDETGEAFTFNGPDVWYENCKEEDIPGLYEAVDGKANFYPAYFFNKIFQDFTDEFLFDALGRTTKIPYELYGFREAVSVHDFSTFYMELSYGKVPNSGNEILIYDYMAYCMIYYGLLEGEIRDAIGKELTDKQTGLTIKISGILKSDYTRYAYLKERKSGKNYDFEESYLSSLQTVFCKPDLIVELKKEKDYSPVFRSYFMNDETEEIFETNIKKLKIISIENITF